MSGAPSPTQAETPTRTASRVGTAALGALSAPRPRRSRTERVFAIAYANGKVYAGGSFQDAGGNANADFLAVWDGVSWEPFCNAPGSAFSGPVLALQVIGPTLYAGGSFQNGAGIDVR